MPMGARVPLKLLLKFAPKETDDPKVNLLNCCDAAWKATVKFTDTGIRKVYVRTPFDFGMPLNGPGLDTLVNLRGQTLRPIKLDIRLLSDNGEQIPPSTYQVTADYENTAEPKEEAFVGEDREFMTRPYRGPWKFWSGTITSGPVTLRIEKAEPEAVQLKVNSALIVKWEHGQLAWTWSQKNPKSISVKRRPGYILGTRYRGHVFLDGKETTYGGEGIANVTWYDDTGTCFLSEPGDRRVAAAQSLRFVCDLVVFETSLPDCHLWRPERGDYKELWRGTVEGDLRPRQERVERKD